MPKWKVYRPQPVQAIEVSGVRMDGSRDYSVDTMPERRAAWRSENVPVIDAEFEAEKAKRDGRPPRIVRCPGCHRNVFVGKACWHCSIMSGRAVPIELPPIATTHTTKQRDDAKRAARLRTARKKR